MPLLNRRLAMLGAAAWVGTSGSRVALTTALGTISIELATKQAPLSCADFLKYVMGGYYDGGRFFRVVRPENDHGHPQIDVVQGGIREPKRAWAPVAHETTRMTGLRHLDGTVSLTRDAPGTGSGAEFFVCVGDQPGLDFGGKRNPDGQGFAAFGRVRAGMDVVRAIWRLPADGVADDAYTRGQILTRAVVIERARVV